MFPPGHAVRDHARPCSAWTGALAHLAAVRSSGRVKLAIVTALTATVAHGTGFSRKAARPPP